MNWLLTRVAASTVLLAGLLTSAAPVVASCQMPFPIDEVAALEQGIREADSVFVGTVTSLSNGNRWATVAVEEVWAGPDLAAAVEVRGAPDDMTTSADRMYAAGKAYLFVVLIADGQLSDNACSATREFTPDLAALRPASARPPITPPPDPDSAAPFDPASLLLPAALIVGAGTLVFGAALVLRRRT
jgi:hypothetical protein